FDKAFETPQVHPHHCFNVGKHITESVRLSKNDRIVRFAMLLHDIGKPDTLTIDEKGITHFHGHPAVGAKMGEEIMRRWKLDNDTVYRVCRLIKHHDMGKGKGCTPALTRKAVSVMEEDFLRLLDVMKADVLAQSDFLREQKLENIEKYGREYERIVKEGECCSLKELAVGGRDLIDAGIAPGPVMGDILGKLLERVLEDPSLNERDTLLLLAKEYI
ncbi:MAG: HD domain-containing protein, partial [Lachnospiraceae bacterium]|nr:HD domain-containing protein [Lachnospiraceae bacterium]